LVRPGRKVRPGDRVRFEEAGLAADVVSITTNGGRVLRFVAATGDVTEQLERHGRVPLPPYITTPLADPNRYQTVYARTPGSAAAPTAGLHFTPELFARLSDRGVRTANVRLDVGLGTFRPIKTDDVNAHVMHEEAFEVPEETADAINACSGRVVAVGTTTLRALETAAAALPPGDARGIAPACGVTRLFVRPGYRFRVVDALVTNFHQPHSTLLLLVGAFAGHTIENGRAHLQAAYQTALADGYRFLSLGDAMFIGDVGPA
jgi:S-adenosylmethionine:tRNA ribosyltransferase-isomerase